MSYDEMAEKHGGPKMNTYQLYVDEQCRYYLGVNGDEKFQIKSKDLAVQPAFRLCLLDHNYDPPDTEATHAFEKRIRELRGASIKIDTKSAFLKTDANHIENLASYFDLRMKNDFRTFGQDFLEGKQGDSVRVKWGLRRVYFRWLPLKRFCQRALNFHDKELEALQMFIDRRGEYIDREEGSHWYRCVYWVSLDLFDALTLERWFTEDGHVL